MGQYYTIVNTDAQQCMETNGFKVEGKTYGYGCKLMEFAPAGGNGPMFGIASMLVKGVGPWAGHRVVITGDYSDEGKFMENLPEPHADNLLPGITRTNLQTDFYMEGYAELVHKGPSGKHYFKNHDEVTFNQYDRAEDKKDFLEELEKVHTKDGMKVPRKKVTNMDVNLYHYADMFFPEVSEKAMTLMKSDEIGALEGDMVVVNLDKKQSITPAGYNQTGDFFEWGPQSNGVLSGLAILLADGNNRGSGDLRSEHPIIGTWAGDRIIVVHATDPDAEDCTDVTQATVDALFDDIYTADDLTTRGLRSTATTA